jgi:pimeloyl-ACP methyl ester carboxylesterase
MPTVRANDIDIYYELHGSARAGQPPLVLAHGFSGSTEEWRQLVLPLAARRQLLLYDVRGHHLTTAPEDPAEYSMPTFAADQRALMLALGIERAHIGGLSMGGMIATQFVLDYPEMVVSFLLCDSSAGNGGSESEAGRWEHVVTRFFLLMDDVATKYGLAELGERQLQWNRTWVPHWDEIPESDDVTRERMRRITLHGFLGASRAIRERPDLVDRLPEIKAPALVIVGEWDSFLPCSRLAYETMKSARFVLVRRAGHGTPTWRPQAFERAVSEFLDAVEAGRPVAGEFEV